MTRPRPVRVLVTDPEQRAALAAVRALGRAGYHVDTIGVKRGLAGVSRYATHHYRIEAEHAENPRSYRQAIARAVRAGESDVVLPVTDGASRMLLGYGKQLGAIVAGPSAEAYARASDKHSLMAAASALGIRVPRQVTVDTPAERALGAPFMPLVAKPARSVVEVAGRTVRVGVRFCSESGRLSDVLDSYPREAYPILLQERIQGDGMGVFLLRTAGLTPLKFGHRRLREKPPAGGVSTYRESWDPPAELVAKCEALLDALEYEGAAMIEFKQDAVSGELALMEINARLWGSVQLAIDAGVDFPSALIETSIGQPVPVTAPPESGVRSVWELGELDHALTIARKSASALDLPPHTVTGLRAAIRVLADHRAADRPEVFRRDDPVPFFAELGRWFMRR